MHDSQIEERLRSVLRAEGDRLPMTIASAELERRLVLRRRRTTGRWVSLIAAAVAVVAVGAIAGIGNGWLRVPAIGTQVSPSPSDGASPTPVVGISRIERATEGRLVLEIEPTYSGSGVAQTIHRDLEATDYVVSVKVTCIGDGTFSFTDGTGTEEFTCIRASGLDSEFQPFPQLVPIANGSFDTSVTVTPGITYTMLVETVPVPDHIPQLEVPKGSIGMASTSDRPTFGPPGTSTNQSSGRLDGSTEWVQVVCLGPGVVTYTLGPADHSSPDTTSEAVCNGVPMQDEISVDFAGDQVLKVTADDRTAWQVVATRQGPLPTSSPSSSPTTLRAPLGRPDQAILVRPIGDL
jgi:hypothetical protein